MPQCGLKCETFTLALYAMRIHTTEKLGPKQSMTPDGFLLCQDVAIARTGDQRYHPLDFAPNPPPVEPGVDGMIRITRDEAEVFRPETIASFEGKPITIGHTFITPENFREVAVGHMQNVRRGTGADSDLLLADFLIQDAAAIRAVRGTLDARTPHGTKDAPVGFTADGFPVGDGVALREVSCGYDADYEQISPGLGRQLNIVGNHVALVERGRAGARCSIQDEEPKPMTAKTVKERLLALLASSPTKDADAQAAIESMDERTEEEKERAKTADTIAKLAQTVDGLTVNMASVMAAIAAKTHSAPAPAQTGDAAPTADAVAVKTATTDTLSAAEILVPGFKAPTADSITTFEDVALIQRTVLTELHKTTDGADLLKPLLKGRTIDALSAEAVGVTYDAATEMQRQANNARGFKAPVTKPTQDAGNIRVVVDNMNKTAQDVWAKTL